MRDTFNIGRRNGLLLFGVTFLFVVITYWSVLLFVVIIVLWLNVTKLY